MFASPRQPEGQSEGEPDYPYPFQYNDDDDDDIFSSDDDEECPWWSDDDELVSDYDEQQYLSIDHESEALSISDEQKEGVISVPCIHHNDTDKQHKQLSVEYSQPALKSWVCENCNAINNLYHSIERGFACLVCSNGYRPGQLLIESKQEDEPIHDDKLYTIWICHQCTWSNDIHWDKCSMCSQPKTLDNKIQTFQMKEKPIQHQRYCNYVGYNDIDPNNNNNDDILGNQFYRNVVDEPFVDDKNENTEENKMKSHHQNQDRKIEHVEKDSDDQQTEFRLFEELQNYKQPMTDHEDNQSKKPSIWNQDFQFMQ